MTAIVPEDGPFCAAPVPVPMAGVAVAPKPAIPLPEDPPIQDLQPDWNSMNQKGVDAIYVSTTRLVPLIPNITQLRNLTDVICIPRTSTTICFHS